MGHISPGNAVDAWQTFKRPACEFRQVCVIKPRHAFVNLLQLRFHQMEVVQQPFGSRGDVLAAVRNRGDVVVGLSQGNDIFLNAGKKGCGVAPTARFADRLGVREAAAMFLKALDTKQL